MIAIWYLLKLDKRKLSPETVDEIVKVSVNTAKKWFDERPVLVKWEVTRGRN